MKQSFKIAEYLDEGNREAQEELHELASILIGWKHTDSLCHVRYFKHEVSGQEATTSYLPPLDHNLAAKVRQTLKKSQYLEFIMKLKEFTSPCLPFYHEDSDSDFRFINSSPTQQIVAALIAKGVLK